jgi:hypothetical protein
MDCLLMATTVRRAAAAGGIHKNTSFRRRHRFLTLPKTDRPSRLSGIAEADEIYFLESEKGARDLQRRGRASVVERLVSAALRMSRCLSPVLDQDVLLVSDGNPSYRYFALDAGISHLAV